MSDATWTRSGRAFGGGEHNAGRRKTMSITRASAMRALGSVVYAARLEDGTVKIGWTEHFDQRLHWLRGYTGQDVELLSFRFGDRDAEQAIHAALRDHVARGREYYHPTPEVMAVVNDMREEFGLPPLAA